MAVTKHPGPDELPLGRLEAFSDGVFAIAITLLVLELGVSATAATDLTGAILGQWEAYLAYVTSFLTIGVMWLRHSAITSVLRAGDVVLYRINLVVLLFASFLPFPTKLIGEFVGQPEPERIAVTFYGMVLLLLDLSLVAFGRYAVEGRRLVRPDAPEARVELAGGPVSLAFYVVVLAIGFFLPTVAVVLYLAIAIYLGVPGKTITRMFRRNDT